MKRDELQGRSVEALKSFNNSISTSRLYPPDAPQVSAAVDRGYKSIKTFLRQYKQLQFALVDDQPSLCNTLLSQEILGSFPNLHIYRQLRLLGLNCLTVTTDMDRFTFNQLLVVFQASARKIEEAGGGLEYVTAQGVSNYFSLQPPVIGGGGTQHKVAKERNILKVRPELVLCILGEDKRPLVIEDLKKRIVVVDTGVSILATAIAKILQTIRTKKKIVAATEFPKMLRNAERYLPLDKRDSVADRLAQLLVQNLKDSALCVLFCQEFPASFGNKLYVQLVAGLSGARIGRVVMIFREQIERGKGMGGESPQTRFLGKSLLKLMSTEKGKLFLSAEKAKKIIHEGERERIKKRLEAGVNSILESDFQALENEEFVEALPAGLLQLQKDRGGDLIPRILKNIVIFLGKQQDKDNRIVLDCLLETGNSFFQDGYTKQVEILATPLILVAQKASLGPQLFEKTISFLQKLMQNFWENGEQERGDKILLLFYQIRSGQLEKNEQLKTIAGQIQDRGIDRSLLQRCLRDCLSNPEDETLSSRLVWQGPIAIKFLVDALIQTEEHNDRLKIIELLTIDTRYLVPVIRERLPNHMPWYGKRNLIKLLGETGSPEDAEAVLEFLRHVDFRVQREAFNTIYKIGGPYRKHLFLDALDRVSEVVTIQIVEAFSSFCDKEVASRLGVLLEEYTNFSESSREPLLLAVFETLGRCPCSTSLKTVEKFIDKKGQRPARSLSPKVWEKAEKALHFLKNDLQAKKKNQVQASQLRKIALQQLAKKNKGAVHQRVITGLPEEQTIRSLLAKGEHDTGVKQLMLLIEQSARTRHFMQAERLKEWLAEKEKGELEHVLRAGEIIIREKNATLYRAPLDVWSALHDALTTEEFSELFTHLDNRKYTAEEPVVKQGEKQNALFFINSGEVKIHYKDEGDDFFISTMKSGGIFGADAFFEPSVWTISVASIGDSEISCLSVDTLQRWTQEYPELEDKLEKFCEQFERVESLIIKNSRDRRVHERHLICCTTQANLVDFRGRNTGITADVEVMDISCGGLAYKLRLNHKGSLRQLLGRKVRMALPAGESRSSLATITGDIVAVKTCKASPDCYSVHMKFDTLLKTEQLNDIMRNCPMGRAASTTV